MNYMRGHIVSPRPPVAVTDMNVDSDALRTIDVNNDNSIKTSDALPWNADSFIIHASNYAIITTLAIIPVF